MRLMLAESVLPDLAARAGVPAVVVHRTLHTAGMWESEVAAALAPIVDRLDGGRRSNPSVAFLASAGQTRVRLTARARDRDDALRLLAPVEADVRVALGERCYGADGDTLESVVIAALRARAATVAVAESLTGGLVASRLAAVPGASAVLRGGVVAYATDVKASLLGVPRAILDRDGAVASSTAEAMAAGVRERLGATYGVALTGVAGPASQEGKPVGLVYLGFAGPDGTESRELRFRGDRERIRTHSVVSALDLLRHRLR
jgi:nicotinamide-nucleotide amidase